MQQKRRVVSKKRRQRRRRRRRFYFRWLLFLVPVLIAGIIVYLFMNREPGDDSVEPNTPGISNVVSVAKDGVLTNHLSDTRIEDYNDIESYEKYIEELVNEFNASGGERIEIKSVKADKNKISTVLKFDDCEAFSEMNGYPFFFGTLSEAIDKGYDMSILVTGTDKSEEALMASAIANPEKRYVVISNVIPGENLHVSVFSNIKYTSNAVLWDKKTAIMAEESQSVIIW